MSLAEESSSESDSDASEVERQQKLLVLQNEVGPITRLLRRQPQYDRRTPGARTELCDWQSRKPLALSH